MAPGATLAELSALFDLTSEEVADHARRIANRVHRLSELWAFHGTPEAIVRKTLRQLARSHRVLMPSHEGLTEQVNRMPGIGADFITSIGNRDYSMIMGTTLFYVVLLLFGNLAVDILYGVVDPRIRVE